MVRHEWLQKKQSSLRPSLQLSSQPGSKKVPLIFALCQSAHPVISMYKHTELEPVLTIHILHRREGLGRKSYAVRVGRYRRQWYSIQDFQL